MSGWKAILDGVEARLVQLGVPRDEARSVNGKIADLWHYSGNMQRAIEQIVSGDAEQGVTDLYILYGLFEDNIVWFRQGIDRAYRNIYGHDVLDTTAEQRESVQDMISAWWPRTNTERATAASIVELRRMARRASVDLSDRELLALQAENVPSRARSMFLRRIERLRGAADRIRQLSR
jgi:hypothetical protein